MDVGAALAVLEDNALAAGCAVVAVALLALVVAGIWQDSAEKKVCARWLRASQLQSPHKHAFDTPDAS